MKEGELFSLFCISDNMVCMKKVTKKKTTRVSKVPKTRNAGTMTESAFWSWIRSSLRNRSLYWKPITQCKQNARRPYKGPLKRQKFEYQCSNCKDWFPEKQIDVDHTIPVGSLTCASDLPEFVERLFCEIDNLACLCKNCHSEKTKLEMQNSKRKKK